MKNKFKQLCLLLVPALAAVTFVQADEPPAGPPPPAEHGRRPDPKKMREHRLRVLDEKLQLTADQKTQINAIWDKSEEKGQAIRDDDSLEREDKRDKMRELMKSTHAEVRAVLTADQQKIFDAMPPERMGGRRGPRPDGEAPPPPANQ